MLACIQKKSVVIASNVPEGSQEQVHGGFTLKNHVLGEQNLFKRVRRLKVTLCHMRVFDLNSLTDKPEVCACVWESPAIFFIDILLYR